jgi:sulfate adenylyltransferase subunit 2
LTSLESESIEILREAVAGARRPVMLYSIGKDSSAMLHLARKAFHPATPPFPLCTWTRRGNSATCTPHRARMAKESGCSSSPTPTRRDSPRASIRSRTDRATTPT